MQTDLYPAPQVLKYRSGRLPLHGRSVICLPDQCSPRLHQAICRLAANHPGQGLKTTFGRSPAAQQLVCLQGALRKRFPEDAYQIDIAPGGIDLKAGGETGLWYGMLTLMQLINQHPDQLPLLHIEDRPDFAQRGVMLDVSRCKIPTLETLFRLIDRLAQLKINQLQLYTEHSFQFVNHPLVWQQASPYSAEDILRIRAFCEDRFIDLVPNLNSFGHMERWLRHPEYHDLAECPEGFVHPLSRQTMPFGSTLRPNRKSLHFLAGLYDEFLPLFGSAYFNIGGDEPWELGQGWSRRRCERMGKSEVYLAFIAEIQKLVEKRGRHMQFWGDIILTDPGSLKQVSRETVALNWGYEARHPFNKECAALARAKIPFYVVPGTSSWNALTGRTRNLQENLKNAARNGKKYGARGLLMTDWGDHGHHQYQCLSYPGYFLGACHAWHHQSVASMDIARGISQCFYDDPESRGGELTLELGRLPEQLTHQVANATVFNQMLFQSDADLMRLPDRVSDQSLENCLARLEALRALFPTLDAGSQEKNLPVAELDNAAAMAAFGIRRYLYVKNGGGDLSGLREALSTIIGRHEQLWLARNRPGGLRESVSHLERVMQHLG
ncbi:MAG: family 20 glycosylhydrolase [Gammaproteobacteria bacterium]|nr:family 20 glycosylhydrolase [Gammaproteobacteria bacterium]